MTAQSDPLNNYVSHVLAAAHKEVNSSLTQRLKAFGVQIEAWRIMETLDEVPTITMSELATRVLMKPPALTKLVDRMVSNGLVHRQIAKRDHREVNLVLTDLGLKRMRQIRDHVKYEDQRIEAILGAEDFAIFSSLLGKISRC